MRTFDATQKSRHSERSEEPLYFVFGFAFAITRTQQTSVILSEVKHSSIVCDAVEGPQGTSSRLNRSNLLVTNAAAARAATGC